ncbi:unnamed protein product [Calypogeia fissa]
MVKEVKLQGSFEYLEPQAVFSFLFGGDRFFRRYHEERNEDICASVSDWTADGHRTLKYSTIFRAPKVLKNAIGLDTLKVTEIQTYAVVGDSFVITSCPTVEHPQGFSAMVEMVLSPADKGKGCTVSTTIILECKAAVWGVQGTLESFMERKAKRFFLRWLRLARLYLMEQVELPIGIPYRGQEEEELSQPDSLDEFFDFSEEDERALNLTAEARTLGVIYSREGELGLQNWIMHFVTGQLNGLHITCNASRSHIEELNKRLQKMEEDVRMVQKHLQGHCFSSECLFWRLLATCLVTGAFTYWRLSRSK